MKHNGIKTAGIVAALLLILFAMVWARAFTGSMRTWEQGEALFQEKEYVRAITYFDRSIHWYTPFNPYVGRSAQRLWEIGARAERSGDVTLALIAYRTIRRGFYGIESVYSPGKAWIQKSDAKIGKLVNQGRTGRKVEVAQGLPPPPDILWSIVVEVGLLGWLGSLVILVFRLFRSNPARRARWASGIAWGVLSVGFFILWLVGLFKA